MKILPQEGKSTGVLSGKGPKEDWKGRKTDVF